MDLRNRDFLKLLDYISTNKYETTMDIEKRTLRKARVPKDATSEQVKVRRGDLANAL